VRPKVLVRESARRDLAGHAVFLTRTSDLVSARFLDAARRSFVRLASMPAMGAAYDALSPSLRGMRRFRVENFEDYLIFYRPVDRGIEVVRVIHGARDIEAIFE
jgi:toxin ParE1/3/4